MLRKGYGGLYKAPTQESRDNLILKKRWQRTVRPFKALTFVTAALMLNSLPTPSLEQGTHFPTVVLNVGLNN